MFVEDSVGRSARFGFVAGSASLPVGSAHSEIDLLLRRPGGVPWTSSSSTGQPGKRGIWSLPLPIGELIPLSLAEIRRLLHHGGSLHRSRLMVSKTS